MRFETPPGQQLQIDFGETRVWIGGEQLRVHLFVATLGYSRRLHVRASLRERQADWFEGMEGAFLRFGGVPAEVLLDNAKALVEHHDARNPGGALQRPRLHAFARYWGFTPRACAPYRARTKGKDERGVGYVKRNAIAGRRFESWAAFEAHLRRWMREVADQRIHGTTGDGADRALRSARPGRFVPLGGRAPFGQLRDLVRRVQADCAIDLDTNSYSVPWRLIGESVQVVVLARTRDRASCGRRSWPTMPLCRGPPPARRRPRASGRRGRCCADRCGRRTAEIATPPALLRPLAEYEALVGGGW